MQLIVISNPTFIAKEEVLIREIINSNLATIHFRKPSFSEEETIQYLARFPLEIRTQIVTHTHPHLAEELQLKGIHFTGRTQHLLPAYLNSKGSKSISTHSFTEIKEQENELDYFFLSPIFKSISKQGYGGDAFEFTDLKIFLAQHHQQNIIALGGIDEHNIINCRDMGFSGVALLGSVWQLYEETKNINVVLDYLRKLHSHWDQNSLK